MCGIYGFIGKPTKATKKAIRELGLLNLERGTDSAGIGIFSDHAYYHYKKAIDSELFFEVVRPEKYIGMNGFDQFVNIIGHTRQATTGAVNDLNAHPFLVNSLVFAHNGVITNFEELQKKYNTNYAVDSQIIGHLLENKQSEIEAFKEISGWFAVPYIRFNNVRTLNIAVYNAPVSFAVTNHGLYYSSQKDHLQEALRTAGVSGSIGTAGDSKLYSFKWNGNGVSISKQELGKPRLIYHDWRKWYYDY